MSEVLVPLFLRKIISDSYAHLASACEQSIIDHVTGLKSEVDKLVTKNKHVLIDVSKRMEYQVELIKIGRRHTIFNKYVSSDVVSKMNGYSDCDILKEVSERMGNYKDFDFIYVSETHSCGINMSWKSD